jgi:hypothetical protein
MAHYAKVEHGVVTVVLAVPDEHERDGEAYLHALGLPGRWIQTSYNTHAGRHLTGGTPLRGNFAGAGHLYDEDRDVFYPPSPPGDWVLDEATSAWIPAVLARKAGLTSSV